MSAYVVDEKCIQRSVLGIKKLFKDSSGYWAPKLGLDEESPDWTKLGQQLWDMNIEAVTQRYGADSGMIPEDTTFKFKNPDCPRIWSLKAMHSLRYQCSEGNVPETPLFKYFDHAIGSLAEDICRELPEYDRAEW